MNPLISVIIPTYNSAKTIGIAIDSILKQTYSNLEIIVVDDRSTDATEEVVGELIKSNNNIFYYKIPFDDLKRINWRGINVNAGWMARNLGIEKAEGEWITFQDADDASMLNRIEVQYDMAQKYNSLHVCLDWQQFNEGAIGKMFDVGQFLAGRSDFFVSADEIFKLSKNAKGFLFSIFGPLHKWLPFRLKIKHPLQSLFFNEWDSYPCAGNHPLVHKKVFDRVKFRPLSRRIWPSGIGRGADRDFNFQVAETFKNSICLKLPLYLWRAKNQNPEYLNYQLSDFNK